MLIFAYLDSKRLLSAWRGSKIGVVICDRRLRYKALNQSLAEIHNLPIDAHLDRTLQDVLGAFAGNVVPFWEAVLSTGRPMANVQICGKLPQRSGVGFWLQNFFPLNDRRGRITHVGCFATEIPCQIPRVSRQEAPSRPIHLSTRESEIVRLLAEGKSNKDISSLLTISVRTVETHRARIMRKLKLGSLVQLVHYAIRNQLVRIQN